MLRTILVQVFNCFRPIFRNIKPQFSELHPKPAALLVWESQEGNLEENLERRGLGAGQGRGAAEPLGCALEIKLSVFW